MAVPAVIPAFAPGGQASAAFESGLRQPLLWLMGGRPFVLARISTPIDLTQSVFTSLTFDNVIMGDGALLTGVTEPGIYTGYASVRVSNVKGNKNLRAQLNGVVDDDVGLWAGDDNNTGTQTPARAGRNVNFADVFAANDYMDIGMYVDTAEAAQVVNGVFWMEWKAGLV